MSLKHIKEGIADWYKQQELRYPNRHREIHKTSCKNCPSEKPTCSDEENYDLYLKELPAEERVKHLFVCAWRPNKLCKGFCDKMQIDQEQLNTIYNERP